MSHNFPIIVVFPSSGTIATKRSTTLLPLLIAALFVSRATCAQSHISSQGTLVQAPAIAASLNVITKFEQSIALVRQVSGNKAARSERKTAAGESGQHHPAGERLLWFGQTPAESETGVFDARTMDETLTHAQLWPRTGMPLSQRTQPATALLCQSRGGRLGRTDDVAIAQCLGR